MNSNDIFYSQFGEDKFLAKVFDKKSGCCVEVGGFDGITGSTTFYFENIGWECLVVEPVPQFYEKIITNRRCKAVNYAASSFEGEIDFFVAEGADMLSSLTPDLSRIKSEGGIINKIRVKAKTLDSILEENNIRDIDFLSIDVEGHELDVLKGFSISRFNPRILVIENNDMGIDNSINDYLKQFDLVRFKITGCNEWYTHRENKSFYSKSSILQIESYVTYMKFFRLGKRFAKAVLYKLNILE